MREIIQIKKSIFFGHIDGVKIKYWEYIMEFGRLSQKDYKKILKFYKLPIHKNKYTRKKKAETILAEKLCKCIKKVVKSRKYKIPIATQTRRKMKITEKQNEKIAVGICRNSVVTKKNLKSFSFTCKKKPAFRNRKGNTYTLLKRLKPKKTET